MERQLRRLAFNLHDGPVQSLSAASAMLERAGRSNDIEAMRAKIAAAEGLLEHATLEMREIMSELRPSALDAHGLVEKIADYVSEFEIVARIPVSLTVLGEATDVSPRSQVGVFRVVQEALTNVRRHSGSVLADVVLDFSDASAVVCTITDSGRGFEPARVARASATSKWGMLGMEERARLLGGTATITSVPGEGTCVRAIIPVESPWA